ncbi:DUF3810 domain-containing protein [Butyrivibrio sp. YAB3001]|uniref:DUF3810 domain-containing protein n=1 Tax=Butyrivibrio sp. YAB3001 TaxID=1520812 RepID=UPI0008F643C0|nr:DUF3810 domain-containing protein [Butyrivibrio sp. YAB3001]SFC84125.1 Protein of unknown function [Butyrivibrio sp. YAB3001]
MVKGKKAYSLWVIITIFLCIIFNLISWISQDFSDYYVTHIFPVITSIYGRITSRFPFSVGEVMLVAITIYLTFTILFIVVHTIFIVYDKAARSHKKVFFSVKRIFSSISDVLYILTPRILAITCVVMSLNCFVLYHCSKLHVINTYAKEDYTLEELANLRDYVVKKCNELSAQVPHDENGNVMFDGNMQLTAIESMSKLSDDYPRLGGYYVTPKALYFSDFMCQQYMQGYYFPFSMEANYNDTMNLMNKPFTMCHELAHTHGYIYEDEANFFGFLACINSDDIVFQYSGYLGVLNYINNDFYKAVSKEEYDSHVKISKRVRYDNEFLSQDGWKQVEAKAVLKTEVVKKAADAFIDTNLKVNGVSSGKVSYTHVVGLIMDYYYLSNCLLADAD